jgi:inorganic pyrophosphatase
MSKDLVVDVIIEIERHSNMKWEYDRINDQLFLDRVLKYPYFYPYAYGFFPQTMADDGDELDVLLITDKKYANYKDNRTTVRGVIVGGLMMRDEKGQDEKIFVVPCDEIEEYNKLTEHELIFMRDNIMWFFSNYKNGDDGKWSRAEYIMKKSDAVACYNNAKKAFWGKNL